VQRAHQVLALANRRAEMRRARRQVGMVQVVRLDPAFHQRPHQRAERFRVVVHAAQQHRLR